MTRGSLTSLVVLWLLCPFVSAQDNTVTYCNIRKFSLPIRINSGNVDDVVEFKLMISINEGRTWELYRKVDRGEKQVSVEVLRDGPFWFVLQSVHRNNVVSPADLNRLTADDLLKIQVDTQRPMLRLSPLEEGSQRLAVGWQVTEEHIDPNGITVEYQNSNQDWVPLQVDASSSGSGRRTLPPMNGPVLVRVTARDLANNRTTELITLGGRGNDVGNSSRAGNDNYQRQDNNQGNAAYQRSDTSTGTGMSDTRYIRKRTFPVNCELEEVGPSGAKAYVYYLDRSGSWKKCGEATTEPGQFRVSIQVQVPSDGAYGLSILVRSRVETSEPVPGSGLRAQMYVVVDTTQPVVTNVTAEAGKGNKLGTVIIRWSARDENLGARPITLQYADKKEGPWQDIITEFENTGRYEWAVPNNIFSFHVRVLARDKARNEGSTISPDAVKVDTAQPKGRLIDIEDSQ